jgi:CheY-like chemotaxis protein
LETDPSMPVVLIIDDQKSILTLLTALFEPMGYQVMTATDGAAGLALAEMRTPDIVLLDWHLPRASGQEVLDELRADPVTERVPVVVLSGESVTPEPGEGVAEERVTYLNKPFDLSALVSIVDRMIGRGKLAK